MLMEYQALCMADVDGQRADCTLLKQNTDVSVQSSSPSNRYGLADLTHVQADFRAI